MKNFLWLPACLALFFAADRAGGFLLQKITDGSQFRYSRLYQGEAHAEILLLGNSRGLTFFQPFIEEKSGKKSFNMSYNGLPMDFAAVLVKDYFEKYPAPESMLIDITMLDRPNQPLTIGFTPYLSKSANISAYLHENSPEFWRGCQISHLFRFNNEIFQRAFYYKNKSDADWLLDREITPQLVAKAATETYPINVDSSWVHDILLKNLAETTDLAQKKGTKVQLVISPYFPGFAKNVHNLDRLKTLCEQKTGLPVHDYSTALTDPTMFGDFMHPNKKGAASFIDRMHADGLF